MAAPEGNKNAETWSEEQATELFNKALVLSDDKEYDFIGEIARTLKTYRDAFTYLANKYDSLKPIHNQILSNLEANCFSHSKTGKIKEATAIMNLKSNYQWTDRKEIKHDITQGFLNVDPLADDPPNASPPKASEA